VTDIQTDHIELRCLVSARDASLAFDLRCDVREAMLAFLRDEMPEALPRRRNEIVGKTDRPVRRAATVERSNLNRSRSTPPQAPPPPAAPPPTRHP